jgi:hypothetical protein
LNIDTIFSRFVKKFGPPKPHDLGIPLIIGEDMQRFGLSFEPEIVGQRMIQKFGKPVSYYQAEPFKILPQLEYQCKEGEINVICNWSTGRLVAGLSVLDSKPYARCLIYHTIEAMPIIIIREFDELKAGVFIAPELWTIKDNGEEIPQDVNPEVQKTLAPVECRWLNRYENTTWWMVFYTEINEFTMRCSNCGTEMMPSDWERVRLIHPVCSCYCPCDQCEKMRWIKDMYERMEWKTRKIWHN